MSEFKVGDRVMFIENSMLHEGIIIENCGRWDGDFYDNYLVKSMIGEFNILAPSLVLDNCINETKFKDLEQRIEKLEKEVFKPKETKPSLLTEDERVILRNLDKMYKYIARDFNDELDIYEKCPEKKEYFHSAFCWRNGGCCESLDMFPNLFKFIKSMEEPYNIEELLKGEE